MERSVMNNTAGLQLVLRAQNQPQFLKWYETFSWLFGTHDNPLTHHGEQINHDLVLRRSKDEELTDTTCCVTDGDP